MTNTNIFIKESDAFHIDEKKLLIDLNIESFH